MALQRWLKRHGVIVAMFAAAVLFTDPYYLGDTADYVASVLGHSNANHGLRWDPLWEFGHVLWRPAGLLSLHLLKAISPTGFGLPDHLLLTRALIGISLACALAVSLLLHSLALSATRSRVIAACVSGGFVVSNAFLNYMQTGNAYVAGLLFVTLGVWIAKRAADSGRLTTAAATGAGAAVGGAALFWFPYAFVIPAAALIPACMRPAPAQSESGPGFAIKTMIAATVVIVAVYGAVIVHMRIHSPGELKEWISTASHGQKPGLTTNAMRLVFGVPRTFIEMGDHGKLIKRFLYHDPYAPTSAMDLVKTAAAPLLLFYATLAGLVWAAAKSPEGRTAIYIAAAAAIPVVFFAVFVFEAGAPERYFPLYPFLALLAAYGLNKAGTLRNAHRYLATVLLTLMVVRSGMAMSRTRAVERQREQAARIAPIREVVGSTGVLALLSNQDDLMHFTKTFPFHPLNRPRPIPIYDVFEPGNTRINSWREDFASRAMKTWDVPGEVWVSKRLVADRPRAPWSWVEGDDPRISWNMGRDFFRHFEYERDSGGQDGFLLLKRSEWNRNQLLPLLSSR